MLLPIREAIGHDRSIMKFPLSSLVALSVFLIAQPAHVLADAERGARKKLKQMETQLKAARESVHEAQKELGRKAEQIEKLEKQIKECGGSEDGKMGREIEALRKKNERLAKQLAKTKKDLIASRKSSAKKAKTAKKTKNKETKPSAPDRPKSITIRYEEGSAANYEGREKVLRWIEARMEKGAEKFSISGSANDSEHEQANEVIALNRAKFLADFLVLEGIPEGALSVSGEVADAKGNGGRAVEVTASGR